MNEGKKTMKVGFIGLGHMGSGMARRLLQAGHDITVYNRTPEKARMLVNEGAHEAGSVADACRGEAVLTMLADDHAVEEIVFAKGGVLQSLGRGAVHISMSTISVAMSERLALEHAGAGQRFLSAPVFGRPDRAAEGKLFIIAGGDADVLGACMPLFEAIGQKTLHVGDAPRTANVVKLSGNFIIASVLEALGEAMALVARAGMDPKKYFEVLTSTIFTGPVFTNYGGLIAERKFRPAGFAAPLGEKDIRLTLAAGESFKVPMPLASLLHDRFLRLIARKDGEELDWSAIGELAAEDAGLAVPG